MTRSFFRTTAIALCLTALSASPARSDNWFSFLRRGKNKADDTQTVAGGRPFVDDEDDDDEPDAVQAAYETPGYASTAAVPPQPAATVIGTGGCYPPLNSALYPCPRPDVPYEVGQTIITNQAFYPHEMLYCHKYKALYPPFYYENKCGLTYLPLVPKPALKGTVVKVKYKSTLPCSFHPPFGSVKKCFSNTQFR
jgi:hypothetical protein